MPERPCLTLVWKVVHGAHVLVPPMNMNLWYPLTRRAQNNTGNKTPDPWRPYMHFWRCPSRCEVNDSGNGHFVNSNYYFNRIFIPRLYH